ncbi:MAG: choice-of-anchor D domain-containing protein [Akkermansiaceae bacterium]|nr:choice-of-anchor D domain-containing protein [Akkermansiaceae bacterium]MCP5546054.1 choice-of-anchor D domain-containing protein [Akkermansiaceae bacterium]
MKTKSLHQTAAALACLALAQAPARGANPEGHRKLVLEGERAALGESVDPESTSYTVTPTGKLVFRSGGGWYIVAPGGKAARLILPSMPAPGGRRFTDLSASFRGVESIAAEGQVAFIGETTTTTGADPKTGLFLARPGGTIRIAQTGDAAPGGGTYDFYGAETPRVSNTGKYVAFRCNTLGGPGGGLFLAAPGKSGSSIKAIYKLGQSAPGGGTFTSAVTIRSDEFAVNDSGKIVFVADTTTRTALFGWNGSKVVEIPRAGNGFFTMFNNRGALVVNNSVDLAVGKITGVRLVVDTLDKAPRGLFFQNIAFPTLAPNNDIAFTASLFDDNRYSAGDGVFIRSGGKVKAIALSSDSLPGGGAFTDLAPYGYYPVPAGDGSVYFQARTTFGEAIFRGSGGKLTRIIGPGDQLEGRTVQSVSFDPSPLRVMAGQGAVNETGQLVYHADLGDTDGLFLYSPPPVPVIRVEKSKGKELTYGKAEMGFGSVSTKSSGRSKRFWIHSDGRASLGKLKVTVKGAHRKDFRVKGSIPSTLKPGAEATFQVRFKPKSKGNRSAVLKIRSNDKKRSSFKVGLSGKGV